MEGDLEKSRKLLVAQGFVAKDNFDDDPDSEYNREEFKKMVSAILYIYICSSLEGSILHLYNIFVDEMCR